MVGGGEGLRQVPLQPEELRRLHLRRDTPADIAQHLMIAGIDLRRLPGGAMIHPDDDIPGGIARRTDRDRRSIGLDGDQRACRVEADTRHFGDHDPRLSNGVANTAADGLPDLLARLLDDMAGLVPDGDRPFCGTEQLAAAIEDPDLALPVPTSMPIKYDVIVKGPC